MRSRVLSQSQRKALEESKLNHCAVVSPRDLRLRNAYYEWCREVGEPFVCVERRSRYSSVLVDMITVKDGREFMRSIPFTMLRDLSDVVRRMSEPDAVPIFAADAISTNKVLNERAESLAGILYAAVTSPRKWADIEISETELNSQAVH